MNYKTKKVLLIIFFCSIIPVISVSSQAEYQLIDVHPSDAAAFTQGLEMHEDELLIGTGLYGQSYLGMVDLNDGNIEVIDELDEQYFGEGLTITPQYIWQLTWRENTAFKRDIDTLEIIEEVSYEGEGWGLAYDEDRDVLWMSDGSSVLEQRDPETFELIDAIDVKQNNVEIRNINELEYANGLIYANVWYTHNILAISPDSGEVEANYDLSSLHQDYFSEEELAQIDTLNGIAHIEDNRFYITGKLYPVIFELELKSE